MINFPLDFWDVGLLFAFLAFFLLVISELLSQYYGKLNINLNRNRLRIASLVASALFIATIFVRILLIIIMR